MSMPKHKGEVYVGWLNLGWENNKKKAGDDGFKFIKVDAHVLTLVPDSGFPSGYGAFDVVSTYAGLPSSPKENEVTQTFEQRVMEFVLAPERSNRNRLMGDLSTYGFFKTGANQVKIIEDILEDTKLYHPYICDQGKKKFREHMGDMLPNRTKQVITLTIEGYYNANNYVSRSDFQAIMDRGVKALNSGNAWSGYKDLKITSAKLDEVET